MSKKINSGVTYWPSLNLLSKYRHQHHHFEKPIMADHDHSGQRTRSFQGQINRKRPQVGGCQSKTKKNKVYNEASEL